MRRGQRLPGSVLAVVLLFAWLFGSCTQPRPSTPSSAQEISHDAVTGPRGSEPDTEVEPFVAVDPNRPNVAMAVFQEGRFLDGAAAAIGVAATHDGGRTWRAGTLPGLTRATSGPYLRASDPTVAFGPDGRVYAAALVVDVTDPKNGVAIERSDDGGLTWQGPVFVERDDVRREGNDFPTVAVDGNRGSPHFGRVYVTFTHGDQVVLRRSDDRGATWSEAVGVSTGHGFVGRPLVQPNGGLTIVYLTGRREPRVLSRTSIDGGRTFGPEVPLAPLRSRNPSDQRTGGVQSASVDPVSGHLFVTWPDTGGSKDGPNQVMLYRSVDGGRTWARMGPVGAKGASASADHLTTAVAAHGGFVYVSYFTRARAGGKDDREVQERLVVSADDGQTFGNEQAIGAPSDLRFAPVVRPRQGAFLGDYMGLAAWKDGAYVVWSRAFAPPAGTAGSGPHATIWAAPVLAPIRAAALRLAPGR